MAHRIDAPVHRQQCVPLHESSNRLLREPELAQLGDADHTVLAAREGG
jgi:hypothetical protein